MCSLLYGGGSLYVNEVFGLDKVVCTERLVHHQVVEFVANYVSIPEPFVVDWNVLYIFLGKVDKKFFVGGLQCNSYLCQSRGDGSWCNS